MHPEFAAQAVFSTAFDEIVQQIWVENWGNVAWRLLNLANEGLLAQPPQLVLRELLAMAIGHSKSKVPADILNDPKRLRTVVQSAIGVDLQLLYQRQQVQSAAGHGEGDDETRAGAIERQAQHEAVLLRRHFVDFAQDSFAWLISPHAATRALVADVVDTVRALRCADALRQRGTVLNTSAGYQIFVDSRTANAVFAFKTGTSQQLLLVEVANTINAGEANVASSELTHEGDLHISFHRGAYATAAAQTYAAQCAAIVINDIQSDVISSFQGVSAEDPSLAASKTAQAMKILIEGVDDNPTFADLVVMELERVNPHLCGRCRSMPSLQNLSDQERVRYLNGTEPAWSLAQKEEVLAQIAATGHKVSAIDLAQAFAHVKLSEVAAGEVLIEAGSPAGFVYIPLAAGLRGWPLGGYQPFAVQPWAPLGNTGVIRGALRNATIVAEEAVQLLMIPRQVYLNAWHATYDKSEFSARLAALYGNDAGDHAGDHGERNLRK
ncbi:MAG: cyclic nucleotide-binding domain-containing protein [Caldilineaceae bacterium]|nr:cyclic nucleotide-binding domain-containing protein [Caldilineaceae bacterium]